MEKADKTQIWLEYEKGTEYLRTKEMYSKIEKHWNFFHGRQWENAKLGDIQPIVINVIKPIVKYKTGVLNQNSYRVVFSPDYLADNPENANKLCELLSKHIDRIFENEKLDSILRQVIQDSCVVSEGILYNYYNKSTDEIKTELIDKNNLVLGNEAEENLQNQPYIIISFRRPVEEIKEEAIVNEMSKENIEKIVEDKEIDEQAGINDTTEETTPMCLVLLKMFKKKNAEGKTTVCFKKCTKYADITEEQETDLELYPVCHFVWESEKGNARGLGEVEANVANQIEINKTETRRALSVKAVAYPKLVYNSKYIPDPDSIKGAGAEIAIEGSGVDDVRGMIGYINPTSMSADSKYLLEELIGYTQELAGAGDNASGNVDPTKTSAKAIIAVQQAQQQPLNEQKTKYKEFLEDLARIYLNMLQVYKIEGLRIPIEEDGQTVDSNGVVNAVKNIEYKDISAKDLQALKSNVRVDISSTAPYDKYAVEQSLENLFVSQKISFEEYVNALPYDSSMPKTKLEEIIKKREQVKKDIQAMQDNVGAQMDRINTILQQNSSVQEIENIANMGNENIYQFQNAIGG